MISPAIIDPVGQSLSCSYEAAFSRIGAALIGFLIVVLVAQAIRGRRIHAITAFLWLMPAALLIASAACPAVSVWIGETSFMVRIRIVMGLLSFVVLLITVEAIRRTRMQERYALLWVATGFIILLTAIYPSAVDSVRRFMGMQYVTCVVAVVFTFLILVAFHFSIAMSAFQEKQAGLAQRHAILAARVAELEKEMNRIS